MSFSSNGELEEQARYRTLGFFHPQFRFAFSTNCVYCSDHKASPTSSKGKIMDILDMDPQVSDLDNDETMMENDTDAWMNSILSGLSENDLYS